MVLSKIGKVAVVDSYKSFLSSATNVVFVLEKGLDGTGSVALRKAMKKRGIVVQVVRKRIFLRATQESGYESASVDKVSGNVFALYGFDAADLYTHLSEVVSINKSLKKAGSQCQLEFLGGWYDKQRKDLSYVSTLATMPTKEVLLGKLLFMMKYPIQGFVATLDQVAKKQSA